MSVSKCSQVTMFSDMLPPLPVANSSRLSRMPISEGPSRTRTHTRGMLSLSTRKRRKSTDSNATNTEIRTADCTKLHQPAMVALQSGVLGTAQMHAQRLAARDALLTAFLHNGLDFVAWHIMQAPHWRTSRISLAQHGLTRPKRFRRLLAVFGIAFQIQHLLGSCLP